MEEMNKERRQIAIAIGVCFVFSGACGLVYEILWTRMLTLIFGNTVYAVGTVLTVFMGGLAFGSFVFGKIADKSNRPLRLYAFLEIGIGLYALLVPILLKIIQPLYLEICRSLYSIFYLSLFLLTSFILLFPTILMGGTLPLITKFFTKNIEKVGKIIGIFYTLNTFGAAIGSFLAGFTFLPTIGLKNTNYMGAVLNLGIGVLVILFEKHLTSLPLDSELIVKDERELSVDKRRSTLSNFFLAATFISGFTAMVYEVSWTRALILVLGSSIYSFSTILFTFILGIAVGSLVFTSLWRKRRFSAELSILGILLILLGISVLLISPLIDRMPILFLQLFNILGKSFWGIQWMQFIFIVIVILLPTMIFGITFPLLAKLYTEERRKIGSGIGFFYGVNTIGSILGSFLTSFILLELLGMQRSILFATVLNILVGIIAAIISNREEKINKSLRFVYLLCALFIIGAFPKSLSSWDKLILNSGMTFHLIQSTEESLASREELAYASTILFHREGAGSTVSVTKTGESVSLRVNGKPDASNGTDMATQLLSSYIALFIHPEPKDVFVLGLGSGMTVGAVWAYGTPNIDCAEIERGVVEGARFFSRENHDVLNKSNVNIKITDGRNFLLSTKKKYDLIITEPSNPWMAGIANLFSKEFYEICKEKLNERGLVCQWIHGYAMEPRDLKMIIATIQSVFPHVTIWCTILPGDYILIGSMQKQEINYERFKNGMNTNEMVKRDLRTVGVTSPEKLFASFVLDNQEVNEFVRGGMINTDDLPLLEFSAPKSLYKNTTILNYLLLKEFSKRELPPVSNVPNDKKWKSKTLCYIANRWLTILQFEKAKEFLDRAFEVDSSWALPYFYRGRYNGLAGNNKFAMMDIEKAISLDPNFTLSYQEIAGIKARIGEDILPLYEKIVALQPNELNHRLALIDYLLNKEKLFEAKVQCESLLSLFPEESKALQRMGRIFYKLKEYKEAEEFLEKATQKDSFDFVTFEILGELYFTIGESERALESFTRAKRLNPSNLQTRINRGVVLSKLGKKKEAKREFERILKFSPNDIKVYKYLQEVD